MDNLSVPGLVQALTAGANLLYVVTENERHTEGIVNQAAAQVSGAGAPYVWTCTDGFLRGDSAVPQTAEAIAALDFALAQPGPALFLMKDLAAFWHDNPFIVRKLKTFAAGGGGRTLVVLGQDEQHAAGPSGGSDRFPPGAARHRRKSAPFWSRRWSATRSCPRLGRRTRNCWASWWWRPRGWISSRSSGRSAPCASPGSPGARRSSRRSSRASDSSSAAAASWNSW